MTKHIDFNFLEKELPPLIWRHRWNELATKHGLPFRQGYMENLDSLGFGPEKKLSRGRVVYLRADLIRWLNEFMSSNQATAEQEKIKGWIDE